MRQFPQQFIYPPTVPPRGVERNVFVESPILLPASGASIDLPAIEVSRFHNQACDLAFLSDKRITIDASESWPVVLIYGGVETVETDSVIGKTWLDVGFNSGDYEIRYTVLENALVNTSLGGTTFNTWLRMHVNRVISTTPQAGADAGFAHVRVEIRRDSDKKFLARLSIILRATEL